MPGNGMHINLSAKSEDGEDIMPHVIAGILGHICEITAFLNTTSDSFKRFGNNKAPRYISWSSENRSQLVRIPAAYGEYKRAERHFQRRQGSKRKRICEGASARVDHR